MVHLNGNLLVAIDIRTVGPDIHEVCIMPITHGLKPDMKRISFNQNLQIRERPDPETLKIKGMSRTEFYKRQKEAMDPWDAAELMEKWFLHQKLKTLRQLMPLAWDWARVRPFMVNWLGQKTFDFIFHWHYRDILSTVLSHNDRADIANTQIPYPKLETFSNVLLRVGEEKSVNTHETCANLIEAYRKIIYAWS